MGGADIGRKTNGRRKEQTMEKIYRVQMNAKGMPNFSTAEEVQTEQVKYFDEDEKVWKIGSVIIDE